MKKSAINRGHLRSERDKKRKSAHANKPSVPDWHAVAGERVRLNWNAPHYPNAFAHVLAVAYEHGNTTLKVCLENARHVTLRVPLHHCYLTAHRDDMRI
jgi:hypothetical protein